MYANCIGATILILGKGEFRTMAKIPVTKKIYIYYKLFRAFLTFWRG